MPNIRWLLAFVTTVHRALYRLTGGRIGGAFGEKRMLLLTTIGRRSGLERVIPLLFIEDEKSLVVTASNLGDPQPPAWWFNLLDRPETTVQIERERFGVRAREASPAEVERLWPKLEAVYPAYRRYRKTAQREIPIVILERIGG